MDGGRGEQAEVSEGRSVAFGRVVWTGGYEEGLYAWRACDAAERTYGRVWAALALLLLFLREAPHALDRRPSFGPCGWPCEPSALGRLAWSAPSLSSALIKRLLCCPPNLNQSLCGLKNNCAACARLPRHGVSKSTCLQSFHHMSRMYADADHSAHNIIIYT